MNQEEMKKCCTCKINKKINDFSRDRDAFDGRYYQCKPCAVLANRASKNKKKGRNNISFLELEYMRNSTIIVKKKRCVNCGNIDYHFSKKMCKQCATVYSTQKRMEEFEDDSESFKNLTSDLDYVFSQYLRNKYADKTGVIECYTCDKKYKISEMQCGHFMGRANLSTRWMEDNCRPQCEQCNCYKDGNIEEFERRLYKENNALVEYLRETARQPVRPTRDELKALIVEYRSKLNLVKKKFI